MIHKRQYYNTFVMHKDYEKCRHTHIFTTSVPLGEQQLNLC